MYRVGSKGPRDLHLRKFCPAGSMGSRQMKYLKEGILSVGCTLARSRPSANSSTNTNKLSCFDFDQGSPLASGLR